MKLWVKIWMVAIPLVIVAAYRPRTSVIVRSDSAIVVNNRTVLCACGHPCVMLMIVHGHIQGFCRDHIPAMDVDMGCNCKSAHKL